MDAGSLVPTNLIATTGAVAGIGGRPLATIAVIGGVLIVLVPYLLAVVVAARRGRLGTGRGEARDAPGPRSSRASVQAALGWLAADPERRSVIVTGAGGRHATLEPSPSGLILGGFDGRAPIEPRDVRDELADERTRRLLAAQLDELIGGGSRPAITTFERIAG